MYSIGVYEVPVTTMKKTPMIARLEPAKKEDMPLSTKWSFKWKELWHITNFEYQNIIKLSYDNSVLGLIRYAIYLSEENIPYLLEVLHLETTPKDQRLVEPIGKWLLWYAVQTGLEFCSPDDSKTLISLDSVEDAITYYRDNINMESIGWVTIAPGEEGYAFRFTLTGAKNFCRKQRESYGCPKRINP
jgi:hypothetical protein